MPEHAAMLLVGTMLTAFVSLAAAFALDVLSDLLDTIFEKEED